MSTISSSAANAQLCDACSKSAKTDSIRRIFELSESERDELFTNAGLGFGYDISKDSGPVGSGHKVIADVSWKNVKPAPRDQGLEEIVTVYSARASAFASSGWLEATMEVEVPFVASGDVSFGYQKDRSSTSSSSTVYVIGRYSYSHCQLTLPTKVSPSEELDRDMREALAITDNNARTKAVAGVIAEYGHVFVSSVEMGGMKHTKMQKTVTDQASAESFKLEATTSMAVKLEVFGGSRKIGGGKKEDSSEKIVSGFESVHFNTRGGNISENDIDKWKASLLPPDNWSATRIIKVKPIIDLFDGQTKAAILACAPVAAKPVLMPMYRLWSHAFQGHFYTINVEEREEFLQKRGYEDPRVVGQAFAVEAPGTVPLYRTSMDNKRYFFTMHEVTRDQISPAWRNEGIVAWVYPTYRIGSKPLWCLVSNEGWDRIYTTIDADRDGYLRVYKWDDQFGRIAAYLPA